MITLTLNSALSMITAIPLPPLEITASERAGLVWMREEEKLARDVYQKLSVKWGDRPFGNIAASEQTHMDAVGGLLTRYGVPDPAKDLPPGKFNDARFGKLYESLISQGMKSRGDALLVGARIEDLDIVDLEEWTVKTKAPDIKTVYENLTRGSRNHLRAFGSGLKMLNIVYKPEKLTLEQYNKIVDSPRERGRGG